MKTVFINKKYASAAKLYWGNSPNMFCPSLPQDIILFHCGPAAASSTEDGKQLCQTIYKRGCLVGVLKFNRYCSIFVLFDN
jgi:hypothetical protein